MSIRSMILACLVWCIICMVTVTVPVLAADPDPLRDFAPGVNNTGFVLRNSFVNGDVTVGNGGIRAGLNLEVFPALSMDGVTVVQFRLLPCGINPPHSHPRATELLTLISGGPLQAGIVDTRGEAFIYNMVPGDIIVFPRGLLHFELNVGTEEAFFHSSLDSQNPGTLTQAEALLKLPTRATASALNTNVRVIRRLVRNIYEYGPELRYDAIAGCVPGQDVNSTTF